MKLRTLADLPTRTIGSDKLSKENERSKLYSGYDLRQSAIKWIKSKELDSHECDEFIKKWIKHFFNIKEEELK
jgi:hypothetical protein